MDRLRRRDDEAAGANPRGEGQQIRQTVQANQRRVLDVPRVIEFRKSYRAYMPELIPSGIYRVKKIISDPMTLKYVPNTSVTYKALNCNLSFFCQVRLPVIEC